MKIIFSSIFLLAANFIYGQATISWQKSLGGSLDDNANSIQRTADGGYIVAGSSFSNDGDVTGHHGATTSFDAWVVKLGCSGTVQWQRSLGGSLDDEAFSAQQTTDGGYIVVGYSYSNDGDVTGHHGSNGYTDIWVIKLDGNGAIQWQKSLGGTDYENAYSIQQTTDGGYILAGYSYSNDGDVTFHHSDHRGANSDIWVIKLNSSGTIQWEKSLGGFRSEDALSIKQTTDGGYIVAGYTRSDDGDVSSNHSFFPDYWILKLDGTGSIQWQETLGGTAEDGGQSIQQTNDGGFIVAGFTYSNDGDVTGNHGGVDSWVIKLDNDGAIQWQKTLGGSGDDYAFSIQQNPDGGYIVAGKSNSNDGDITGNHGLDDFWIVNLDGNGVIQWQKAAGGSLYEYANSITNQTATGEFIVAGLTGSNNGDVTSSHNSGFGDHSDFWVVKFNGNSPCCSGSVSAGPDVRLYFGYAAEQCVSKTAVVTNGTPPYTYQWTLDRPLLYNVITPLGDESMTGANTATVNICLLDTANLCVTVTDANGCVFSDCAMIFASDVRCFAGNSNNQKVNVCHNGNVICVNENAVSVHLGHGDHLGSCSGQSSIGNVIEGNSFSGENNNTLPGLNVYPNPSLGNFKATINFGDLVNKTGEIQIVNVKGQVIKRININNQEFVNIHLNTAGIYLVRLVLDKKTYTKKLVVIK